MPKPREMFIDFLVIETAGVPQIVHEPKWPPILAAIQALDGVVKTVVCLVQIGGARMDIGNGAEQRCVVSATGDDQAFYLAIEPGRGVEPVNAKVNGQVNEYPAEVLVTKDAALRAAKLFAEQGQLEPSIHWRSTTEAPNSPPA